MAHWNFSIWEDSTITWTILLCLRNGAGGSKFSENLLYVDLWERVYMRLEHGGKDVVALYKKSNFNSNSEMGYVTIRVQVL